MNIADQMDAVEIMNNPQTQREKLLVEAFLLDAQEVMDQFENETLELKGHIDYLEEEMETRFAEKVEELRVDYDEFRKLKKEVRELRKKNPIFLREKIEKLLEVIRTKEKEIAIAEEESRKMLDWNCVLRSNLNLKTKMFYHDMVALMNELEKSRKSKYRVISMKGHKGDGHRQVIPVSIKRRWSPDKQLDNQ
jgi:Holliday junction resolvase